MSNTIPIDKGVPVPPRRSKYPWNDMQVGDSFLVPQKKASSIRAVIRQRRLKFGLNYIIRNVDENNARVWRVE